jgi:cobalt-zinc-cadmium efflux system membrane fusion protein
MLRDLHLTTARVEERIGAEEIALLAEVGVAEDAYAEIAPPIAARVLALAADVGDRVEKGTAMAELQSSELGHARSDYLAARARADAARRQAERLRSLSAERIAPKRELESGVAEAAAAEAEVAAARAALDALGVGEEPASSADVSRFALRAPLAGTVLERDAALGRMTDPAKPMFRVADLSRVWLIAHAFERESARIAAGATARVTLQALPERELEGRVTVVGRVVDPAARTVPVRVVLHTPDHLLRPGLSARARVAASDASGRILTLPASATQRVENAWVVFVPRGPAEFEVRRIGRGRDLGAEVEILSGLESGETVVVDGAFLLKAEVEKAHGGGEHHHH